MGVRCCARVVRRGPGYPPCGRQGDVTGTVSAPVASPHTKSGDVMTSFDLVYAGRNISSNSWSKELALLRHEVGQVEVPHAVPPLQQRAEREEVAFASGSSYVSARGNPP